jgi:predicted nucleic acid-binding protein
VTFSLDTNIISYILRGDKDVADRWCDRVARGNRSVISIIAYYEIKRGLISANATTKLKAFEELCTTLGVSALSLDDVDLASVIYATRKKKGQTIEDADLLIAAQAVARGYTLVTNNAKHFEGIDGLIIENWKEITP